MTPTLPEKGKLRVWMHKRTGRLVEVFNSWIGPGYFYDMAVDGKAVDDSTPVVFSDDKRWQPKNYIDLGEL